MIALCPVFPVAASRAADAPPCISEPGRHYAVTRIVDGETLKLDTGDELKLAGILSPRPPADGEEAAWPPAQDASTYLSQLVLGRKIEVRSPLRRTDRYGRLIGHVIVEADGGPGTWLQDAIVRAGHARVFGLEDRGGCETALLAAEIEARDRRIGLWQNEAYRVRKAEGVRDLVGLRGTFQIVEGRVQSTALRGARAYLNFGSDWTRDFTVLAGDGVMRGDAERTASREVVSAMKRKTEAALKALEGREVRVRGWVRLRNGPMIQIERIEDVELLP